MSARKGDKARFHRQRIARINRKMRQRELRKELEGQPAKKSPPAA